MFKIHRPHVKNPASADGVLIAAVVALPFSRERITHLKAVRVRLCPICSPCWTSLPQQDRVYFREIRRENKKSEGAQTQKGKSNPLITLIWVVTLLYFEVVRPCGECRGGQCADSGFRSLLSMALRINERAGKKEQERKRKTTERVERQVDFIPECPGGPAIRNWSFHGRPASGSRAVSNS